MKAFIGGLMMETNSFSPMPTGLASFSATCLKRGTASVDQDVELLAEPLRVWRSLIERDGGQVCEGLFAVAEPGGPVAAPVYEALRDELLDDLKAALPVDTVLLFLHGAMVAHGYDDCEGDLIARVRSLVGPDVVIGVELDLHAHLTELMVTTADFVVTCKEYPHTDFGETAARLLDLCSARLARRVQPTPALIDCRMVGMWRTLAEPVRSFVEKLRALERQPGILSVSFAHGFPWGDVEDSGARLLVIADGDATLAATTGQELRDSLWRMRDAAHTDYHSVEEAVRLTRKAAPQPIVLADISDNPGGGAPGDSTFILAELVAEHAQDAVVCSLWDPIAVRLCFEAGTGATIDLRIGGKIGPSSGRPLDLRVEVRAIMANAIQTFQGAQIQIGDAAWVRAGGIDIILNTLRVQTFDPSIMTQFGIDPAAARVIVVKSTQHFYKGFAPISDQIFYVAAPGAIYPDFAGIPYRKKSAPYWPAVSDPFACAPDR